MGRQEHHHFTWHTAAVELLERRVAEGDSAAMIATAINARFGASLSRNAVIGKVGRLGLSLSGTAETGKIAVFAAAPPTPAAKIAMARRMEAEGATRRQIMVELGIGFKALVQALGYKEAVKPSARRTVPARALAIVPAAADEPPPPPPPIGSVDLLYLQPNQCRWPYGVRSPFKFCGCSTPEGKPYCAGHAAKAYQARTAKPLRPPSDYHRAVVSPSAARFPADWGLTRSEATVLALLVDDGGSVSRGDIWSKLYEDRASGPDMVVVDKFIERLRTKLRAYGVGIFNDRGQGFSVDAGTRERFEAQARAA